MVTEGLARKTGALSSKVDLIDKETKMLMIDRLDANQNLETEQNPLAISANDETFPVCCSS